MQLAGEHVQEMEQRNQNTKWWFHKHLRMADFWICLHKTRYLQSAVFGAETADRTCPKALFPTQGATARVHQVSKVSPACRSLIQRKFHGFGNSENNNNNKKNHLITTLNTTTSTFQGQTEMKVIKCSDRSGKGCLVVVKVDKELKENLFLKQKVILFYFSFCSLYRYATARWPDCQCFPLHFIWTFVGFGWLFSNVRRTSTHT